MNRDSLRVTAFISFIAAAVCCLVSVAGESSSDLVTAAVGLIAFGLASIVSSQA